MIFRKATEADLEEILSLERACFSDPWRRETLLSHLQSEYGRTLVAQEGERVVGCFLGQALLPEGEVFRVMAEPALRRRGIGRGLVSLFLEQEAGMTECFLEVREGNLAARALYEGLGFSKVGSRRNYYKNPTEDAWVMKWERC